ncbi:prolipoprotein diacylglyceryl transferase family protein [Hymenobacter canadensis]|uniref:Prolipoprotein diacylglyceryl transferase n=1 Tax=Hymenobacter canadensis TaxID=2999067 RepID=A0ABY7LUJ1_9BACT|nr:prolipoprotein diacylglyceryl transferase family protein [Hymenobacter canadensis]WBA42375.1 prolipoprotein diacylglyceryl transferase [Hymenobacter canadensis]
MFYLLAFSLNLALLVWEGHRRAYPMRTWLVLLACTTLSFILGTKLLALSGPEWRELLHTGHWPDSGARTVLGGALAGTLTLLALRRPFGFSWHVFDAFTLPMCAALAVQCVGCVLTGCCFGELTAGGWGLTYAPGTLPYLWQESRGLIAPDAVHSLPVHPTQLYSLVLCLAVGGVLLLTRHRAWPGGSRRLLHLGLLLAGRFLIEFWRDPAGEQVGADFHTHAGLALKQVQWALLLLVPLVLGSWAWLIYRSRHTVLQPEQMPTPNPIRNLLAVAGLLLLTAWLGPQALTRPEVLVVKTLLLTVLVLEGGALLLGAATTIRPARVALPLTLAAGVLVLTSQTPVAENQREHYTTLSAGVSTGEFERLQNTEGGCGGSSPLLPYQHRYTTGTLDLARTRTAGTDAKGQEHKADVTFGLRLHVGTDRQLPTFSDSLSVLYPDNPVKRTVIGGFNPYLQADRPGFGLGLGLLLGPLGYHRPRSGDQINPGDFQVSLRLGRREWAFGQFDFNYLGYGSGNPQHRIGMGTGFGSTRWQLIAGAAVAKNYALIPGNSRWSGFAEAKGQLTPQWGASTFLTLGNPTQRQLGLRLSRRLGK